MNTIKIRHVCGRTKKIDIDREDIDEQVCGYCGSNEGYMVMEDG